MSREYNFDGIVGPTHNYAGLSHGNLASASHRGQTASPRAAALQGLAKMRFVANMGIGQAVLPPLPRPRLSFLRELGFQGKPAQMIEAAYKFDPALLAICYSASNMWTANAATVSPGKDTADNRLHMTTANLTSLLHRSIEADQTHDIFSAIFSDSSRFILHRPLPYGIALSDEGAANHTRLCLEHSGDGLEIFVYGRSALDTSLPGPRQFPARQTLESCQTHARRHRLDPRRTFFLQQNPEIIDAGVFHNDVISVGSANLLMVHELAFVNQRKALDSVCENFLQLTGQPLRLIEISNQMLPIKDVISSYLFNSQLLLQPDGRFTMICPSDCQRIPTAQAALNEIVAQNPGLFDRIEFLDLRQSMNNGGGPACLRLRIVLTDDEKAAAHQSIFWTAGLDRQLVAWVENHFRSELSLEDLRDPELIGESARAGEALARIIKLPVELLVDKLILDSD